MSQCSTYHSNGKVVVYNAVRHWVPSLFLVCGCDINLPAIQHHLCTVLNVPQDLKEAFALIASGRIRWDKWDVKMGLEYLVPHDWHFANTKIQVSFQISFYTCIWTIYFQYYSILLLILNDFVIIKSLGYIVLDIFVWSLFGILTYGEKITSVHKCQKRHFLLRLDPK